MSIFRKGFLPFAFVVSAIAYNSFLVCFNRKGQTGCAIMYLTNFSFSITQMEGSTDIVVFEKT